MAVVAEGLTITLKLQLRARPGQSGGRDGPLRIGGFPRNAG